MREKYKGRERLGEGVGEREGEGVGVWVTEGNRSKRESIQRRGRRDRWEERD